MTDAHDAKEKVGGRLSAEEAVEAMGQIAEITKTGLPLGPGLRALAAESGRGRTARMFRAMADRLDRGATFAEAIAAMGKRVPAHVRAVFTAGATGDHLVDSLEELIDLERSRLEFRRKIRTTAAYPVFLLLLLVCLYAFWGIMVVPTFQKNFEGFEDCLPVMTQAVIALSGNTTIVLIGGLIMFMLLCWFIWILPGPGWLRQLQKCVPVIGPLRYWGGMIRFMRLMAILVECRIPLPEALRIASGACGDPDLWAAGNKAAACVEGGEPLVKGFTASRVFLPTIIPLVGWGQQNGTLANAFRTATEVFEQRAESQAELLAMMLLPCVFLIIFATVPFCIIALFMPLIPLIQCLT